MPFASPHLVTRPGLAAALALALALTPGWISAAVAQDSRSSALTETAAPTTSEADKEASCTSGPIEATTDRPTASISTETTQCGVFEFLAGPESFWIGHGLHQDDLAEGIQFGITHALDFHYSGIGFFTAGNRSSAALSGVSDTNLGLRYRFNEQRKLRPSFGAVYNVKVPTASVANGLSTGRFDNQFGLLASKDFPHVHFDFDAISQITGRSNGSSRATGFDRNADIILVAAFPVTPRLTLAAGSFGLTRLNATTPAYAEMTTGIVWQVHRQLILDLGWDEGLTSAAPRKRLGVGLTFAPANLYVAAMRLAGRNVQASSAAEAR